MSPNSDETLDTRIALLEHSERRDAKDFEELKEQNAQEHKEIQSQIGDGFAAQTVALDKLCKKVDDKIEAQDDKIEAQGERLGVVEEKQRTISIKAKLVWGAIVFVGTSMGGAILKYGIPAILAVL